MGFQDPGTPAGYCGQASRLPWWLRVKQQHLLIRSAMLPAQWDLSWNEPEPNFCLGHAVRHQGLQGLAVSLGFQLGHFEAPDGSLVSLQGSAVPESCLGELPHPVLADRAVTV